MLQKTMLFVFNKDDLEDMNAMTIESLRIGTMVEINTMFGSNKLVPVLQKVDPSFEC